MSSERRRHQLYEEVRQVLSDDAADELMSALPPVGWGDVATRSDLGMIRNEMDAQRAELRGDMSELGSALRDEMAELGSALRGEMAELGSSLRGDLARHEVELQRLRLEARTDRQEVRGEIRDLRSEMRTELEQVRAELRIGLSEGFQHVLRWSVGTMIAMAGLFAAAAAGVAALIR